MTDNLSVMNCCLQNLKLMKTQENFLKEIHREDFKINDLHLTLFLLTDHFRSTELSQDSFT